MNKKISAAFIVMLFLLSVVSVPVEAHFTLGKYKGTYDYHELDYDGQTAGTETAHIPGLTGYVFPGAGPLTSPAPGFLDMAKGAGAAGYPGYQSLYPNGNPKGSPQMWLQADANSYAPFGAILTSTIKAGTAFNKFYHNGNPTIWGPLDNEENSLAIERAVEGDLVFAINYTLPVIDGVPTWPNSGAGWQFDRVEIWVPPEFQGVKKENIVCSFTNDWGNIASISKPDIDADIVPNHWQRIRINTDTALGGTGAGSTGLTYGNMIIMGNSTYGDVWVYVRINKVTAPTVAGKYFFKMGMRLRYPKAFLPDGYDVAFPLPAPWLYTYTSKFVWLGSPALPYGPWNTNGVPNFPVLLVKGEVDPAYVDGTVRYGGYSGESYYGRPIALPGRVRLVGRAIDPFTLAPTNRPVEARGYFNQSANGHFEVEGVAPGIYDIYASCAGYPERLIQTGVTILKGQSYHLDAYLTPGVVIEGEVFSKCGTGEVNWVTWQHNNTSATGDAGYQDIKIEIYKIGSVAQAVGTCAVTTADVENVVCFAETKAVTFSPVVYNDAWMWGRIPVQFQWPGYGGAAAVGRDSQGVGPRQEWRVLNTRASFKFKFGDKGLYGTPAMFSGHVPQLNATWIDGLPAGSYEVRAFTYGYVQTKADGITFEHVTFNVPAVEWPGDIYVPFDLRLSNYVKKTVHFHDIPGTLAETKVPGTAAETRILYLKVEDAQGNTVGWKTEPVSGIDKSQDIYTRGIRAETMLYWGTGGGRNYGFESGTYKLHVYMWGYVEQASESVTIGLCGSEIAISDHMYRGVLFNVTFYSKDWEHPTADKAWKYPDEYIYFQIWKGGKQLTGYGYDAKNAQAAGSEYYIPDGNSFTHDATSQPFGVTGKVLSAYRIKAGDYVYNKKKLSWVNPTLTTFEKSFATLYYEGQEAYHGITSEAKYYYDADWNIYPEAFESGLYELKGLTYGYVMQYDPLTKAAKPFQVYATKGGVANIPIKLVVGVQIPLIIRFKHERVFEHLRMNSSVRVRVFDDKDNLVGEWLTSGSINGTGRVLSNSFQTGPILHTATGGVQKGVPESALPVMYAGGLQKLNAILGPGYSFDNRAVSGIESVNYVPRSTMMLNLSICGLPDPFATGSGTFYAYNGFDRAFDVRTFAPGKFGAPGAPYGINGDPWYTGGYYVEVEVVPFGAEINNHHLVYKWLPGATQAVAVYDNWYPVKPYAPVAGLLYGESATIDPRTGKLYSWAMPQNHIGPYQQRVQVVLPGAHLGGESSGILELDHLGLAQGVVYSYTWCDDWRTTSWISVLFSGAPGALQYYTFDGTYQVYLPAGTWKMDVVPWLAGAKSPGYGSQSFTLAISEGQTAGYNVYLEETGVPIPEFPTALVVLVSALAAALSILRRRRK